jgi:hypothetical protein
MKSAIWHIFQKSRVVLIILMIKQTIKIARLARVIIYLLYA